MLKSFFLSAALAITATVISAPLAHLVAGDDENGPRPQPPEKPAPGEVFKRFDQDSSGDLSKIEFMDGLHKMMMKMREHREGKPGHEGRKDKEGRPERDEQKGGEDRKDGPRPRPDGEANGEPQRPGEGERRQRAENAFTTGDANNDGVLSQEEFRVAMKTLLGDRFPRHEKPEK
jgi:EF-hand domain pair/EF hand